MCSSAASVGTTRARPSQHSQPAEPPPPAITPQTALNQSLLQQQNGNTSMCIMHVHMPQFLVISNALEREFPSVCVLLFSGEGYAAVATTCDVMLPHSCEREGVKGSFTVAHWLGHWTSTHTTAFVLVFSCGC